MDKKTVGRKIRKVAASTPPPPTKTATKKATASRKKAASGGRKAAKTPAKRATKTASAPAVPRGCVEQFDRKYQNRPSPAFPANECPGRVMTRNGVKWESKPVASGKYHRWVKVAATPSTAKAAPSRKRADASSTRTYQVPALPARDYFIPQHQAPPNYWLPPLPPKRAPPLPPKPLPPLPPKRGPPLPPKRGPPLPPKHALPSPLMPERWAPPLPPKPTPVLPPPLMPERVPPPLPPKRVQNYDAGMQDMDDILADLLQYQPRKRKRE